MVERAQGQDEGKTTMGIYWRNGKPWGRKRIKGLQHRAPLEAKTKREAEAAYATWVGDLVADTDAAEEKVAVSFREAVDKFTDEHLGTLKPSSQERYLVSLLNLVPHFELYSLPEITRSTLTAFVSARRKEGVTDSTIIRDLACLSSMFTIASDWEMIDVNPVLPFLRMHKKRKSLVNGDDRTRYLSHMEELHILSQAALEARTAPKRRHEKWMEAAIFAVYIDTGLRAQELLIMPWSWVDLQRLEITVPKEVAKSEKDRVVPILPRTEHILRALPKNAHTNLVFWRTAMGRGFADLNKTFQHIAARAGVHDVIIHDLRRTCGCRLLQDRKLSMEQVRAWLGHASVKTTERIYAFLKVENLHEAVGTRRVAEDIKPKLATIVDDAEYGFSTKRAQKRAQLENSPLLLLGKKD